MHKGGSLSEKYIRGDSYQKSSQGGTLIEEVQRDPYPQRGESQQKLTSDETVVIFS